MAQEKSLIDKVAIGKRLADFRTLNKIPQWELANSTETAQQTISAIENGKLSPTLEMVGMLYKVYQINPVYLVFGDGAPQATYGAEQSQRQLSDICKEKDELILQQKDLLDKQAFVIATLQKIINEH
jgi:transcriptional regulator with XRE-family HTH domain